MRFGDQPTGLAGLLTGMLKTLDLQSRVNEQACLLVWEEVVGEQVASSTQPEFIRDGRMFVKTKSSVWANELSMYKSDIISRLNRRVGATAVRDIIFKAGRIAPKKRKSPAKESAEIDLGGISLDSEELSLIEETAFSAGEDARDSFKELLLTAARLEKWKQLRGWTPCTECGALQNSESGICPVCQIKQ